MTSQQVTTKKCIEDVICLREVVDDMFRDDAPTGAMAHDAFIHHQADSIGDLATAEDVLRTCTNTKDFWITKSGSVLLITEMTDGHLVNAIRWCHRQYDIYLVGLPFDDTALLSWQLFPKLPHLQDECDQRGLNWRNSR